LKYLGLLLPMMVINTLFSRLFMASHKIKESFWYQICFNIVLIAGLFINVRQFGYIAYPITLVSVHLLNVLGCYFLEKWYFKMIDYTVILKKFLLFIVINIAVGTGVSYLIRAADLQSPFLSLAVGCSLYLGLILLIGLKFKLNDIFNSFIQNLWKRSISHYGRAKHR